MGSESLTKTFFFRDNTATKREAERLAFSFSDTARRQIMRYTKKELCENDPDIYLALNWIFSRTKMIKKQTKTKRALTFLAENKLMALSTVSGSTPWVATVFFAHDRRFNLLFFSREDTKHCRHIRKNPQVAVAINHAWRNKDGTIRGVQMTGRASRVAKKEYARRYRLFKKRFPWADDFAHDHVLYLIRPKEVWLIDEQFFGHFYRMRIL